MKEKNLIGVINEKKYGQLLLSNFIYPYKIAGLKNSKKKETYEEQVETSMNKAMSVFIKQIKMRMLHHENHSQGKIRNS